MQTFSLTSSDNKEKEKDDVHFWGTSFTSSNIIHDSSHQYIDILGFLMENEHRSEISSMPHSLIPEHIR